MKKLNPIAKCVIVLSCIVFVCGGLLIAANKLLFVSNEERLGRSFSKLFPEAKNIVVETLYDLDNSSIDNAKLTAFNSEVPARDRIEGGKVLKVYKLKDDTGSVNGKYVIEAEATGFKSKSVSHIAFNANGTVYGVTVKSFGASENLSGNLNLGDLNSKIVAASAANAAAGNFAEKIDSSIKPGTGATVSMGGILNATNIASIFLKEVIFGVGPVVRGPIELVTDSTKLSGRNINAKTSLNALLALDSQSPGTYYELTGVKKASAAIAGIGTGDSRNKAEIVTTYLTADNQLILHVEGEGYSSDNGGNGEWAILALMNSSNRIQAVYMISNSASPEDSGHDDYSPMAQFLNSAYLTAQLKDKDSSYFSSSSNSIFMTEATETNNGIKVVAYLAVNQCESMRSQAATVVDEHGLPNGEGN